MINVKFFARLRDQLGQSDTKIDCQHINTVADVRSALVKLNPPWQEFLTQNSLLVAINQTMGSTESLVHDGDEVAFFPPVTGG